jgi:hypothetical protein
MEKIKGTAYLPVSITFSRADWRFKMHWYKDNPYYYYSKLFVSPFVTGMDCTREKDFPEATYVVADSGGYQIGVHRKGINVSVLDVLRWQEKIADVAFTVDIPAYSYETEVEGYRYYTQEYFERCMIESNKNAWKMLEAQENPKMQLWGVVQGGNYNDLKKWYDALTKEHTFKGYTLPMASTFTPKENEDFFGQLQFAKEVDTNFHFLGRCEPLLVVILAKMSQQTGHYYTYDTATAATGLMLGKYHDPMFLSSLSFSKKKPETQVKFDMNGPPPCDCPVCSKHTVAEMIDGYYTLLLHNVYVRKRFNDYVNVMVQDDQIFNEIINKFLNLQPRYQKQKKELKDKINRLIFDEKIRTGGIDNYF